MNINSRKVVGFIITFSTLTILYIVTLIYSPRVVMEVGGTIVISLAMLYASFVGGVTWDKWVKRNDRNK